MLQAAGSNHNRVFDVVKRLYLRNKTRNRVSFFKVSFCFIIPFLSMLPRGGGGGGGERERERVVD